MNREKAKEYIRNMDPDFLPEAPKKINGHTSYICPSCGNGGGSSGDGIALDTHSKDAKHYKCFVCGIYEDVISLWKLHNGITDDLEAFRGLYNYYGLEVETPTTKENKKTSENAEDYTEYYKACAEQVGDTDYFKKRGLSEEVVAKYRLGYDASYTKGTGGTKWEAVIIPTGVNTYVARNTNNKAEKENRYRKNGGSPLYLKETITEATSPIFIVEGELDALSIIEVGGDAVGLGSTANCKQLVSFLKDHKPAQPIILALDNDEDGKKTAHTLATELTELSIPFYRYNPYGENKDANGALTANREAFIKAIKDAVEEAESKIAEELEAEKEAYLKTSTAYYLQDFINGIADSVNTPCIPTGFKNLDNILDGGLYEGLYILGAISSLGKTTLVLQIADQIAKAGEDVLIFSLEMARSELIAKSVSRLTIIDVFENEGDKENAKTNRGITTGSRYKYYSQKEKELINRAIATYGNYANNIYIIEGVGNIGTEQIRETVQKHIKLTGKKPVVFIDYVQILAPAEVKATDKQNIDKAVLELKRISRDFKLPVIGISSINRQSYNVEATMEMLKESGSLEYGSDCVLGLQLKGVADKANKAKNTFDINEAKRKDPREVELIILKNRNGSTGNKLDFKYYPKFNYFEEVEKEAE